MTETSGADELSELLKKHEGRFETQAAYADAIDIDVGRLNRLLNKKGPYSLSIENCLKFARLTGEDPSFVLRAAGKLEIASLIESLYGEPSTQTRLQREVSALVEGVDPRDDAMVVEMLRTIVAGAIQLRRASSQSSSPVRGRAETASGSPARARGRTR